jgi:molecular chaperone GrpE (heat shock protein)
MNETTNEEEEGQLPREADPAAEAEDEEDDPADHEDLLKSVVIVSRPSSAARSYLQRLEQQLKREKAHRLRLAQEIKEYKELVKKTSQDI